MTHITRLEQQPYFPVGDLTPTNADMLKYILPQEAGLHEHAAFIATQQRALLHACHNALVFGGFPSDENPRTLSALATGFAGYETIVSLVTEPKAYDIKLAAAHADKTFSRDTDGQGILQSIRNLSTFQPLTLDVIQELGSDSATDEEVTSLMAGAAVARQLQLPPLQLTWE